MDRPVEISFDCLPLRTVGRLVQKHNPAVCSELDTPVVGFQHVDLLDRLPSMVDAIERRVVVPLIELRKHFSLENEIVLRCELVARQLFVEHDGVLQPAPAPRFSRTPGQIRSHPSRSREEGRNILSDWGFSEEAMERLEKTWDP